MTTERYMAHVVRPLPLWQRENDRLAWRNVGIPEREKQPLIEPPRDWRRCQAINNRGVLCDGWAGWQFAGARFCHVHRPEGAERR